MKLLLTVVRIFVGVLFIFSGLVKANDPLGLSYKMQEYFEVWHLYFLNDFALAFALVMNVFEIVAGIALLLGWRMKLFSWLLLLLIIFFTFLTGYAAFSGKIAACGCFGDCIPLTPIQSFWKDVLLLVLILLLLIKHRSIRPLTSARTAVIILTVSTLIVAALQWYVLRYLPVVDCLPYKKGNNLVQQMEMPEGYIPDEYSYVFKYEKDGRIYAFNEAELPDDLDDSYEFVDREQKLVKKGNNLQPKITDFNLTTMSGTDTTEQLLQTQGRYVLVFARQINMGNASRYNLERWQQISTMVPLFIVTADVASVQALSGHRFPVLKADATVIKTAARANPTYFVMEGAVVKGKFSYANGSAVLEMLQHPSQP